MTYLIVKWLHVLSSTVLFGTGLGSAYYLFCASRTRDARAAAAVGRDVVRADWIFTATTVVGRDGNRADALPIDATLDILRRHAVIQ